MTQEVLTKVKVRSKGAPLSVAELDGLLVGPDWQTLPVTTEQLKKLEANPSLEVRRLNLRTA